jgi:hypothetical protein
MVAKATPMAVLAIMQNTPVVFPYGVDMVFPHLDLDRGLADLRRFNAESDQFGKRNDRLATFNHTVKHGRH